MLVGYCGSKSQSSSLQNRASHVYIHLDYVRVEFLSYIYIYIEYDFLSKKKGLENFLHLLVDKERQYILYNC